MTKALIWLRGHIAPDTREKAYLVAALAVATLGTHAQLSSSTQAAILTVITASIGAVLAVLNSTSGRVAAFYGLAAAVAGVLQIFAASHANWQWAGWVGIAAGVIGQGVALLRAPTGITNTVEEFAKTAPGQAVTAALPDLIDRLIASVLPGATGAPVSDEDGGQHRARD